MGNPRTNQKHKPTFLWQALLIVLPVAVLAVLGFLSLRQDRLLAQRDAAERAQAIADELVPKIWSQLTTISNSSPPQSRIGQIDHTDRVASTDHPPTFQHPAFRVDQAGNLLFPPPYSPVPNPHPLNPANLSEQQVQQWTTAQTAEWQDASTAVGLYRDFLATNPPADFAPIALYRVGVLLDQQHEPEGAVDAFEDILVKYPAAVSEAGLPLDAFARLKLVELTHSDPKRVRSAWAPSPDDACSNIIYQPSFLTPRLLSAMNAYLPKDKLENWQSLWAEHESARALFAASRPLILNPSLREGRAAPQLFWFTTPQPLNISVRNQLHTSANDQPPLLQVEERDWLALRVGEEIAPAPKPTPMTSQRSISHNGMSDIEVTGPATAPAVDLETTCWYVCRGQSEIASELDAFACRAVRLPDHFGIGLELAGKKVGFSASDLRLWREVHYNGKGSGERKEVSSDLATTILASATKSDAGSEVLKVNIYLTSPAMLYKLQTARTFWFGALILFSALAALLGLLTASRAFHRQLQLSEMKSNFVASVSHELRAPIASVRLMAESLERGKITEPAKQNEYFRFIGQESRRLSSLIENVLDFSRIEQGRKQYEFEPTDLLALADKTVKLMQPYAAERQIALKLENNLQPPTCSPRRSEEQTGNLQPSLDGRAIQQALVNLLDNAIKHSRPNQTVTVGIEPPSTDPSIPAPSLHLYVEDSGEGIPAAEHEKIFERFYRLGSELRRETQGVGIGLSIVKHIVEAHGGRILVRSAPGQGSRFTIELPVQPQPSNNE